MWSSRLYWRFFSSFSLLAFLLTAAFATVVAVQVTPLVESQVRDHIYDAALLTRQLVQQAEPTAESLPELNRTLTALAKELELRITVVDGEGVVLIDTHENPRDMENHRGRPEMRQAASADGLGEDKRFSQTLGIRMYYLALPVTQDEQLIRIVRVAVEAERLENRINTIQAFVWGLAAVIVILAMFVAAFLVRRTLRPLERLATSAESLALADPLQDRPEARDEITVLAGAVDRMQRQLAERIIELRANADRLRTVLQNMVEGIVAIDADETIQLANDASHTLFDSPPRDLTGRPLYELTRARPVHEAIAKVLATGETVTREFETGAPHRRVLALRATCLTREEMPEPPAGLPAPKPSATHRSSATSPPTGDARTEDSAPTETERRSVMLVLHDQTELRRLENLRHELVANVSHELKTPLASIKAYAETLRLGAIHDPEHNESFLARIEEQADRLHQLILDLLQLARMESEEDVFDITDIAFGQVVRRCLENHRERAEAKQLDLRFESAPEILVRADADGLQTLLNNLIDNAIKYTPSGGSVTVRWGSERRRGFVSVEDTGPGIAAKHQARVFERFFRVDKARSREMGGTGLGLAIVKNLAEAFGGDVELVSNPGEGCLFRVFLPLA